MVQALILFFSLAFLSSAQTLPAFRWIVEVDGSGAGQLAGIGADSQGNIYLAGTTQSPDFQVKDAVQSHFAGVSDIFVTKLDPDGNIVYSTYFGGGALDTATAMTVDPQGNVYVTGNTASTDFPTTPGAYSPSLPHDAGTSAFGSFLFKLNPDGSAGYSTYFANSLSTPNALAVDAAGSVYLTGLSYGGLVATPGAYRTGCNCIPPAQSFSFFAINDAYLTRFDPTGASLIFSTYLGAAVVPNSVALAPDGSAFVAGTPTRTGAAGVYLLDATGASLLASGTPRVNAQAIALARDGTLYLAGQAVSTPERFAPTPGAFQPDPGLAPNANALPSAIVRMDAQLQTVLAATYFGGAFGAGARNLALDPAGNVYLGGYTSPRSLPTRTPFVQGFGSSITGYVAELTPDLSTLLFSSAFGDNEIFGVNGLVVTPNGAVVLAGSTGAPSRNVWANSLALAPPPALRIDAVQDPVTGFTDPLTPGATIQILGSGFTPDARLTIAGVPALTISITPTRIVALVPPNLPALAATIRILTGDSASNDVLVAVAQ